MAARVLKPPRRIRKRCVSSVGDAHPCRAGLLKICMFGRSYRPLIGLMGSRLTRENCLRPLLKMPRQRGAEGSQPTCAIKYRQFQQGRGKTLRAVIRRCVCFEFIRVRVFHSLVVPIAAVTASTLAQRRA